MNLFLHTSSDVCRFLEAASRLEVPETCFDVQRGQEMHHSATGSMSRLPSEANVLETCKCNPDNPGLHSRYDRTQTVQETQNRGKAPRLLFFEVDWSKIIRIIYFKNCLSKLKMSVVCK